MSLINDALKRAREAEQQRGGEPPPETPLQPAEHAPAPRAGGRVILLVLVVVLVALAASYMGRWVGGSEEAGAARASNAPPAGRLIPPHEAAGPVASPTLKVSTNVLTRREPAPPPPRAMPPTSEAPAPPQVGAPSPTDTNAAPAAGQQPTVPGEGVPPTAAAVAPAEPQFPELKLQSIIFRLRNPAVVINGQMLSVGDTVSGARVVRIERHAVTMEWQGQTNILRLPQF